MQTDWTLVDFARIQLVSFDLGYTVLCPNYHKIAEFIQTGFKTAVSIQQLMITDRRLRVHNGASENADLKNGNLHYSDVLCEMIPYVIPGVTPEKHPRAYTLFSALCRDYHDKRNFFEVIYPDALQALILLQQHHVPMIVISNAHGTLERDLQRLGLSAFFEHILDSAVEGVSKPDEEIFVRALDRAGVAAEDALHVGDNPYADIFGALRIGMQAALYDPIGMFAETNGRAPQFRNHLDLAERLVAARI